MSSEGVLLVLSQHHFQMACDVPLGKEIHLPPQQGFVVRRQLPGACRELPAQQRVRGVGEKSRCVAGVELVEVGASAEIREEQEAARQVLRVHRAAHSHRHAPAISRCARTGGNLLSPAAHPSPRTFCHRRAWRGNSGGNSHPRSRARGRGLRREIAPRANARGLRAWGRWKSPRDPRVSLKILTSTKNFLPLPGLMPHRLALLAVVLACASPALAQSAARRGAQGRKRADDD